jgi:hypothetical protein
MALSPLFLCIPLRKKSGNEASSNEMKKKGRNYQEGDGTNKQCKYKRNIEAR